MGSHARKSLPVYDVKNQKRMMVDFISLIFTLWASLSATTQQGGRAGGFHLLRY
jgi:hypothetical protein